MFTSAKNEYKIETILEEAVELFQRINVQLPTAQINKVIHETMEIQPPRMVSGRRFKCYYATQTGNKPLRVRLFCNSEEKLDESYERFLLAKFYEAFELGGVPVKFDFVGKPKQERTFFATQQSETVGGVSTSVSRGNSRIALKPKKEGKNGAGRSRKIKNSNKKIRK